MIHHVMILVVNDDDYSYYHYHRYDVVEDEGRRCRNHSLVFWVDKAWAPAD